MTKDPAFQVLENLPDGSLRGQYVDPKRSAYQYMDVLQHRQGLTTTLVIEDGVYSVSAPGLATLRFAPAGRG